MEQNLIELWELYELLNEVWNNNWNIKGQWLLVPLFHWVLVQSSKNCFAFGPSTVLCHLDKAIHLYSQPNLSLKCIQGHPNIISSLSKQDV